MLIYFNSTVYLSFQEDMPSVSVALCTTGTLGNTPWGVGSLSQAHCSVGVLSLFSTGNYMYCFSYFTFHFLLTVWETRSDAGVTAKRELGGEETLNRSLIVAPNANLS